MSEAVERRAETDERRALTALLPDLRIYARFLAGPAAADDLVQETVVRALAALPQFEAGTSLKAWLFTIERNLFYEQARRRVRETRATERHGAGTATAEAHGAALADLQRALFRLPPIFREALVLVGAEQLTHEEAAAICGVAAGTMRARVTRARALLADLVGPIAA